MYDQYSVPLVVGPSFPLMTPLASSLCSYFATVSILMLIAAMLLMLYLVGGETGLQPLHISAPVVGPHSIPCCHIYCLVRVHPPHKPQFPSGSCVNSCLRIYSWLQGGSRPVSLPLSVFLDFHFHPPILPIIFPSNKPLTSFAISAHIVGRRATGEHRLK